MTATKTPSEVIDKWREEFEVYCDSLEHKIPVVKNRDGNYTFLSTKGLFDCWIAARQSVVIQLPEPFENEFTGASSYHRSDIEFAITEQGYRVEVKGER